MFRKMKNIDTAFRQMRLVACLVICGSLLLAAYTIHSSRQAIVQAHNKVYILAGGKAIEAFAGNRKDNLPVEARNHVKMFHHYFFTLYPDEKAIGENLSKALYLADASAKQQYDNLKEKGFYANLIAGNISQEITVDSVTVNLERGPFYFRCYAWQRITRATSVVTRSLVTEGLLRQVARSDNNAHGFLIERWAILENEDLQIQKR